MHIAESPREYKRTGEPEYTFERFLSGDDTYDIAWTDLILPDLAVS